MVGKLLWLSECKSALQTALNHLSHVQLRCAMTAVGMDTPSGEDQPKA